VIEKIELKNYGKFTGRTFNLSPFTLFLGDNEAGKSTIFDALMENVCKATGTHSSIKALKDRYGEGRDADVVFKKGCEPDIPIDEFLSLYAISSGEVSVNLKDNKGWAGKVMASLITGGVNPKKIYESLSVYEANSSGTHKHIRDKKNHLKKIDEISKEIENKKQRREEILSQHKNIDSSKEELKSLEDEIKKLDPQIKAIEDSLSQQNKIRELKKFKEIKKLVVQREGLARKLEDSEMFKDDKTGEIDKLDAEIQEEKDKQTKILSEIEVKTPIRESREKEVAKIKAGQAESGREQHATDEPLKEVEKNINLTNNIVFNTGYIVFGLAMSGLGIGLYLMLQNIYLAGVAALIGIIILILKSASKGKNVEDLISRLKTRYKDATGKSLTASDIPSLKAELLTLQQEYLALEKLLKTKEHDLSTIEAELKTVAQKAKQAEIYIKELIGSRDEWYAKNAVRTKTEYLQKISEYKHNDADMKKMNAELATEMAQLKQKSIQDLDAELVTRIQILEPTIYEEEKPDDVVKKEVSKLRELNVNLNNSKERKNEIAGRVESSKGKIEGGLENFNIDILLKKKSILEKEVNEQEIQIEGGRIAAGIFRQIADDSSVVFKNLSARASKKYGVLLPEPKNISISSITSDKEIMVEDAGGTARHPDYLSRGTRDLFYFALRLTLAESSVRDGKVPLLVLDEPFHSFDEPRTTKALELLRAFQKEHGSQIIMFSKDKTLEKIMQNILGEKLSLEKLA
jgi:uncharacterized protein YhaN